MSALRIVIILNAAAGSVKDRAATEETLRAQLPGARVLCSTACGEARELTRAALAHGCDLVVAAGGDGTLNEVLNGFEGDFTQARMGLLPLGTGNDFARSIGVPAVLDRALEIIRENKARALDVIRVTGAETRYMINASAGGFSARVTDEMTTEVKERWGPLCYARAFVGAIADLKDYRTEILLDSGERLDTPAYNVFVANGRTVAGGVPIAPSARLDDGLADLLVLPVASLPQLAMLAPATLLGQHLENENIVFRRARRIEIRSEPPMRFNTDGELFARGPVTFEVVPAALEFVIGELAI